MDGCDLILRGIPTAGNPDPTINETTPESARIIHCEGGCEICSLSAKYVVVATTTSYLNNQT
jgi:hypothetical protein